MATSTQATDWCAHRLKGGNAKQAEAVGKDLAMQVAARTPLALDQADIAEQRLEKELEIGRELARKEGKPAQIIDKIAQGRLQKFLKENTLLKQSFVKDNTLSVEQYLAKEDKQLCVTSFLRCSTAD